MSFIMALTSSELKEISANVASLETYCAKKPILKDATFSIEFSETFDYSRGEEMAVQTCIIYVGLESNHSIQEWKKAKAKKELLFKVLTFRFPDISLRLGK